MKADYPETATPISVLPREFSSGVAERVKGLSTRDHVHQDKLSYWQLIFLQSKANDCSYRGENLPHIKWQWPRDTWFQEQLSHHLKAPKFAAHQVRD